MRHTRILSSTRPSPRESPSAGRRAPAGARSRKTETRVVWSALLLSAADGAKLSYYDRCTLHMLLAASASTTYLLSRHTRPSSPPFTSTTSSPRPSHPFSPCPSITALAATPLGTTTTTTTTTTSTKQHHVFGLLSVSGSTKTASRSTRVSDNPPSPRQCQRTRRVLDSFARGTMSSTS